MKRTGIIHADLARLVAGLRHTDTFVICDAGLPLAPGAPCVDLGYRYGQARFVDVTSVVLPEVVVEHTWVSQDVLSANAAVHHHLLDLGLTPQSWRWWWPMRVVEALGPLVTTSGTIGVMSSSQGSLTLNTKGGHEVYRASKSALNQLMRSYAARHRDAVAERPLVVVPVRS